MLCFRLPDYTGVEADGSENHSPESAESQAFFSFRHADTVRRLVEVVPTFDSESAALANFK
jgi:hypothetical protein